MARRAALTSALVLVLMLGACVGPPSLHQSVLGYDETISRLEREMLLLNIARVRNELPIHFTVTTSIAATFDYRVNAGVVGALLNPGANTYTFSLGASAAENPTLSIVPIQGEEFTRRILTPMDENKFEFLSSRACPSTWCCGCWPTGSRSSRGTAPSNASSSTRRRGRPSTRSSGAAPCTWRG